MLSCPEKKKKITHFDVLLARRTPKMDTEGGWRRRTSRVARLRSRLRGREKALRSFLAAKRSGESDLRATLNSESGL